MRNLILTGGIRHPFEDASRALADLLEPAGFTSEVTTDIEEGIARLAGGGFALVTVYALRWRMLGDPKYAPERERWAFSLSEHGRAVLQRYVRDGGGLFGLHTACLCFDDWPEWRELLGGAWRWGKSFHPPRGPVLAEPTPVSHPITRGLAAFEVHDEVYSDLDLEGDTVALVTGRALETPARTGSAPDQPLVWARAFGAGRVAFDGLGHDRASIEQPAHGELIRRAARWAARAD